MPKIQESIVVNADQEKLRQVLEEPEYIRQWYVGLDAFSVSPDHPQPGSTQDWTYKVMGVEFKGLNTVMEYEKYKKMVLNVDGLISGTQTYTLTPQGNGIRVEIVVDYKMSGGMLGKLAEPVVHQMNTSNIRKSLEEIKRLAEG